MENSGPWRKPSDVMRLHKKRKSVTKTSSSVNLQKRVASSTEGSSWPSQKCTGQKRRNPFGCCPGREKRSHHSTEDVDANKQNSDGIAVSLLGILDDNECKESHPVVGNEKHFPLDDSSSAPDDGPNNEFVESVTVVASPKSPELPVDWSLKTKARFLSPEPFAWCTSLKTIDESVGLTDFTHNSPDLILGTEKTMSPGSCTALKRTVQKHSLYWQHPNLPWLKLFPRIVPDHKIGKIGPASLGEEIQSSLQIQWAESFLSLFNQLRGGQCPYFYVCGHQFTVLFRAPGVGGRLLHAILTPTSRGFRESLKKEGIEFTMPLAPNKDNSEMSTDPTQVIEQFAPQKQTKDKMTGDEGEEADDDDDDDITGTDEGASSFLQTLGLDCAQYKSLDPSKIKIHRETFHVIDHRPESLVLVEDGDTQALFNFLLNCRSCIASSGIQAGIPPTLLSPTPFKAATLKTLKLKSGSVHQRSATDGAGLAYTLEVEGTLLPHSTHGLVHLFSRSQSQFTATFSSHETSVGFNGVTGSHDETPGGYQGTGIQASHSKYISKECSIGKTALRDVSCKDGTFTYRV